MRHETRKGHGKRELRERPRHGLGQGVEHEADGTDGDDASERKAAAEPAGERAHRATGSCETLERERGTKGEERRARDEIARAHGPAAAPLDEARVDAE